MDLLKFYKGMRVIVSDNIGGEKWKKVKLNDVDYRLQFPYCDHNFRYWKFCKPDHTVVSEPVWIEYNVKIPAIKRYFTFGLPEYF